MDARAARHGLEGWADLHVHSAYSLLDGASSPEPLAARAAELGYAALALTDHDSLAGLVAHAQACAAHGIRPIAGVELTLDDEEGSHLTLLARDGHGYASLARLVSTAQLAGHKGAPRVTLDDVAACAVGLECLTGCRRGRVAAAVLRGEHDVAWQHLGELRAIFGAAHVWVEVQRGGLPDDGALLYGLQRLARRAGLPLVATGNVHYARAEDRDLQDVLTSIRTRTPLAAARGLLRPGAAWRLRSLQEMALLYHDLPTALQGTVELAKRCGFRLDDVASTFPTFAVPPGHTPDTYLRGLAGAGVRDHYGEAVSALGSAVALRLEHELATMAALGLASYVLVVWDMVRFARDRGILCQGRGSAVGSLVCYALGITAVDPLYHTLSFERFLSPGRTDPPDIDVDFPSDRDGSVPAREAVIAYMLGRYAGHAALLSTHVTFRARSAVREVGMALGLSRDQQDLLAATVDSRGERGPGDDAQQARAAAAQTGLPEGPLLRRVRALCARLEGLPRHLGQHPGGIILTARPLATVAPLERARMAGRIVAQWDKDDAEAVGLAKIDVLGLGMLAVLDHAFTLIGHRTGQPPTLHGFRCDDPRVFAAFRAADTVGVFQLESRAQMSACLPHLQPRCYEDLIVAVALIRPGPVQGNAVHPYLRRRRGEEPVTYPGGEAGRRLLAPVLGETLGVCLYQDQVIGIGRAAGLSAAEAADLRRAMSSGRSKEKMALLRARLEDGLAAHGLDVAARHTVLATVEAFASYGFLKGHAAAFAYLSYISCWLKVYHPAIFLAALLTMQPMGFYPPEVLVQDAVRHGVRILPVDLRRSRAHCTLEDGAVRLGLSMIRGLGSEACRRLDAAMLALPARHTWDDVCVAACLSDDEAHALALAGALCGYFLTRRQALWQAPPAARAAHARWLPGVVTAVDPPVILPTASPEAEIALDRASLGLSLRGHVLASLRPALARRAVVALADLVHLPPGLVLDLAGQVVSAQRPGTARGVLFLSLSDETGMVTVVVLPPVYARYRSVLRGEVVLWIRGVLERRGTALTVRAKRVSSLTALLSSAEASDLRTQRSPLPPCGE